MNADFKLAAVNGIMYTGGNICFTSDNRSVLSPVNSYISSIGLLGGDVRSHLCANSSIQYFDVSPDGDLIIAIGNRGLGFFYSISAQVILDTISFPPDASVSVVRFSPCSCYVALGLETTLQIYAAPARRVVSYHACARIENIHNALARPINHIDWTPDSRHVLVSGQDALIKIYPREVVASLQQKGLVKSFNNLIGHRSSVIGAFFMGAYEAEIFDDEQTEGDAAKVDVDTKHILSVSSDNAVYLWRRTPFTRREFINTIKATKADAIKKSLNDNQEDDEVIHMTSAERIRSEAAMNPRPLQSADEHLPAILRYAYEVKLRHLLQHRGRISVTDYHRPRALLVVGYEDGTFAVHNAGSRDCALVHLLSITSQSLTACCFSPSGAYIAFGSAHLRQLLVWDWRNEENLLKEQSHYYDITTTALTTDGQHIVSGSDDGKLKVWSVSSGQCVVTFTEHQAGITGIATSNATNAFFSASKDGTVRGYDLVRYRNFRVFTPAERTQCSCLEIDPSGEVLAVGSARHPRITLFSVQTGQVVDTLEGHEGPVMTLAFHPTGTTLASGAMDKQLMIWDIFGASSGGVAAQEGDRLRGVGEPLTTTSEVLCVKYSSNGKRMVTLMMNSEITIYDVVVPSEPQVLCSFKTHFDAAGGWTSEGIGPRSANSDMRFTTIDISPDGDKILAAGDSKWMVLYHALQGYAIKKWPVSQNLDVEGVEEQYKWRLQSEAGNLNAIDVAEEDIHLRKSKIIEMPGAKSKHFATGKRKTALTIRTMHLSFADNGRSFVAATTDGLLVYSVDAARPRFLPTLLTDNLTPATVRQLIDAQQYVQALISALYLHLGDLVLEIIRRTPKEVIPVAVNALPHALFPALVIAVSKDVGSGRFLTQSLLWAQAVTLFNNESLLSISSRKELSKEAARSLASDEELAAPALRFLHRELQRHKTLQAAIHDNFSKIKYLKMQAKITAGVKE